MVIFVKENLWYIQNAVNSFYFHSRISIVIKLDQMTQLKAILSILVVILLQFLPLFTILARLMVVLKQIYEKMSILWNDKEQ